MKSTTCSSDGEKEILAQFSWGNVLGRLGWRWEDNIKLDLREVYCEGGRWMELDQDHIQLWSLILVMLNLRVEL